MTERFEPIRNSIGLKDNETGKEYVYYNEEAIQLLNNQHKTIKALEKEVHLEHMRSMFSTVKSFKGDVSKRYKYDEETDTIYDTANHYGQHSKILDKKEVTMLLNEYNSMFGDMDG